MLVSLLKHAQSKMTEYCMLSQTQFSGLTSVFEILIHKLFSTVVNYIQKSSLEKQTRLCVMYGC